MFYREKENKQLLMQYNETLEKLNIAKKNMTNNVSDSLLNDFQNISD